MVVNGVNHPSPRADRSGQHFQQVDLVVAVGVARCAPAFGVAITARV
jgi:hypothetical protein